MGATFFRPVTNRAFHRETDRQTDRQLSRGKTALHAMHGGKNEMKYFLFHQFVDVDVLHVLGLLVAFCQTDKFQISFVRVSSFLVLHNHTFKTAELTSIC